MMQTFPKGIEIMKQGERGHVCYILAQGDVEVTVDGKTVNTLHAGSYFGNRALLSEDCVRTATCTTLTKVRVWSIDRLTFQTIMRRKGETEVRLKQKNKILSQKGRGGGGSRTISGRKRSKSETFVMPVPKLSAKSFRVVKTLGKGAYGEVVLARYELSSEAYVVFGPREYVSTYISIHTHTHRYAIKKIDTDTEKEIEVMSGLCHGNIAFVIGRIITPTGLFIVFPFYRGGEEKNLDRKL